MASKRKTKQNHLMIFSVIILIIVTASVFYCIKAYVDKQKNKEVLITNTITMNYTDDYNGLIIPATSVFSDEDGKVLTSKENIFDFVITSKIKDSTKTNFSLYLVKDKSSTIPDDKVKVYLEKSNDNSFKQVKSVLLPQVYKDIGNTKNKGMLLEKDVLSKNAEIYYRLRIWIDQSYLSQNPNDFFKASVNINAE